jgi:hypothetical protein
MTFTGALRLAYMVDVEARGEGGTVLLPRSLVPQEGYPPLRVPAPGGDGWIKPQNLIEQEAA